ncbi:hypothetical protein [Microlunatus soli]|uniref:Uncharacterized protein n=1 Tax=Microlunatus soli TaxID=630515 RepID=A0A1H1XP70_9ACTN|nr:hypothetical protein [Microlunatus soli]SDT10639.1 hypothetical protein SAMN04489812_4159 [Microlunatus soli]
MGPNPVLAEVAGFEVLTWHPADYWAKHTQLTGGLTDVRPGCRRTAWSSGCAGRTPSAALGAGRPALGLVHVTARKPR